YIVLQRYLSVFLFIAISVIIYLGTFILFSLFDLIKLDFKPEIILVSTIVLLIILLTYFPLYFKFGYFKTRFFNMAILIIFYTGMASFKSLSKNKFIEDIRKSEFIGNIISTINDSSIMVQGLIAFTIVFILYIISYFISSYFYRKREFND
ncbi:MAG: ABC-2 transporter permease, partial [Clostridiales bacterium]